MYKTLDVSTNSVKSRHAYRQLKIDDSRLTSSSFDPFNDSLDLFSI